jgi:methionine-S-sulfoxide reductase
MKIIKILIILNLIVISTVFPVYGGTLSVTAGQEKETINIYKKVYFAGGCFWCMEESFDKVKGVIKSVSGYSGGKLINPTYKDVIYKDTGHVETIEITYDPKIITYKKLLNIFWKNIDPFDQWGQFCDKGKSYRSVIFYQNFNQKRIIKNSVNDIEKMFNSKVVTLVWKFNKFYIAEDYHQDYYQKNFLKYLSYKKACQREEVLEQIWN